MIAGEMTDHANIAAALEAALTLKLPPIAVCFSASIPPEVRRHEGNVPAGCVFWEKAANGAFATSTPDHELCAVGVYTHNLARPTAHHAT